MANSDEKPSVLIVILNYNGEEFLEECLDSIETNTEYQNYQTLVVDNGSSDGSEDIAEEKESVELMSLNENIGLDIGNNVGIYNNPEYDYYLLLNNDTKVNPRWLKKLVETGEEYQAGIVGPKILNEDQTIQSVGFKGRKRHSPLEGRPQDEFKGLREVDAVHGSAWMISRELIDDIGYLDEIFSLGDAEEWDYCARTKEAGYDIYVTGESELVHKGDMTKDRIDSRLIYLLTTKNSLKEKLMNGSRKEIVLKLYSFSKKFGAGLMGYRYNPPTVLLRSLKEVIFDLPNIISKRRNRAEFVPSYYAEGIRDYSKRYDDFK